jgi:hypothetical protein
MAKEKDQNRAGQVSGEGSPWFNSKSPQTGDGKTKRDPFDRVESIECDVNGKRR